MPELPEVETVKRGLNRLAQGIEVKDVAVYWPKIVQAPEGLTAFKEKMVRQQLESVERRGKYLLFYWTDYFWISHLRMEGKYLLPATETPKDAYTHVVLTLTDGRDLRYRDVRKFGRIYFYERKDAQQAITQLALGPEPWDLSVDYLKACFECTNRVIKACLLDQHVIAGIGNIYADEILFASQICPTKKAKALTDAEIERLIVAMQTIFSRAVELGGTTIRTYTNALGENGTYQQKLKVYGRAGEPCPRCQQSIQKMVVAQRGTHYCPHCQCGVE